MRVLTIRLGLLLFALTVAPLAAQGNGKGRGGGGGGGGSAVALETVHFLTDSSGNPVDIHWSDELPISEANDGHEITFDKHGTYKMTMQCADPGDCLSGSFVISLLPVDTACPAVEWREARMSLRVDDVESVDTGTVSRSGWAQIRQLVNGEAVGVLYTINWDGQNGAKLIDVTGDGAGTAWVMETQGGGLANLRVPSSGKGNKAEVCGLVYASFSLETYVLP